MTSVGGGRLLQHAETWFVMASLDGREYTEVMNSKLDGLLRMRVSVCSFITVWFRGICHMRVRGHRHPQ